MTAFWGEVSSDASTPIGAAYRLLMLLETDCATTRRLRALASEDVQRLEELAGRTLDGDDVIALGEVARRLTEKVDAHVATAQPVLRRPVSAEEERAECRIRAVGRLLPTTVRARQIREWLDEVACACEANEDPRRVVRSILIRSVAPIAIGVRVRRLRHLRARPQ